MQHLHHERNIHKLLAGGYIRNIPFYTVRDRIVWPLSDIHCATVVKWHGSQNHHLSAQQLFEWSALLPGGIGDTKAPAPLINFWRYRLPPVLSATTASDGNHLQSAEISSLMAGVSNLWRCRDHPPYSATQTLDHDLKREFPYSHSK